MDDRLDTSLSVKGRYVLEEEFARGGMGQLWRAHDREHDREHDDATVAIKFMRTDHRLDPAFHQRFQREVNATAQVVSDHVVKLLDSGVHQGRPFLVMEYIPGQNLHMLLRDAHPLPIERAVSMLRQIVAGVAAAHEVNVLHRDIKPLNVLVLPDDTVKVCDFGIAKILDEDTWSRLTQPGHAIGSFRYMAPERFPSDGVAASDDDVRSDLYSLGCLAYEVLAGQPPFLSTYAEEYKLLHRDVRPRPLHEVRKDIPDRLARLVHALLEKRPTQRPPTAGFTAAVLDSPPLWASGPAKGERRLRELAKETGTMLAEADQRRSDGQHGDAMQRYRQVVLRRTLMLGPGHPDTLAVRLKEVDCRCARADGKALRDCLARLRQVVKEHTKHLGDEHPHTITALQSLAALLRDLGDLGAALDPLRRVARALARTHGKDASVTLTAEHEHACCLREAGHPARAASLLSSVTDRLANIHGHSDQITCLTRHELGLAWQDAGEFARAASVVSVLLEIVTVTPHPDPRLSPTGLQQWLDWLRGQQER